MIFSKVIYVKNLRQDVCLPFIKNTTCFLPFATSAVEVIASDHLLGILMPWTGGLEHLFVTHVIRAERLVSNVN